VVRAAALAAAALLLGPLALATPRLLAGSALQRAAAPPPRTLSTAPLHAEPAGEEAAVVEAPSGKPALNDERLLGTWRYGGGAYEIRRTAEGRVVFSENGLAGELRPKDGWLVAELPPAGTIQLKLNASGTELVSNFRPTDSGAWGDTITAIREWASLSSAAGRLERDLDSLEFEGSAANGSVVVVVNGRQRPIALRISPDTAAGKELGPLVREAHSAAVDESLDAMTEKLRQLYATHLSGQTAVPAQEVQ